MKSKYFGTWNVTEHRLRTMKAYIWSIITGSIFNPVIYLFALGIGVGSYIDSNSGNQVMGGLRYLVFVGPALLASSAMTVSFEETSFPVMGGFKWTREFWAMNAAPLTARQIVNGVLLASSFRTVFTVLIFWLVLFMFGALPSANAILAIPAACLGGLSLATVMTSIAGRLEEDNGWFAIINRLIIAPMFLFSGTFFPLEQLPIGIQWIGWISPLWHSTQLGRVASFAYSEPVWLTWIHLAYLLTITIVCLALAWRIFDRRLSK